MHYNFEYYDYNDISLYRVRQVYDNGYTRIVPNDSHDLAAWIGNGNIPTKASMARFLSVVDNEIVVDPNKDAILATEETIRLAKESEKAEILDTLATNLPTWIQVETAISNISNLAEAKAFLLKLSKVVYHHIKGKTNGS